MSYRALIPASLLLALGIAGAGFLLGQNILDSRQPTKTVTVKGLAERLVKADLGFWPLKYQVSAATLEEARAKLDTATNAIEAYIKTHGFTKDNYFVQSLRVQDKLASSYNQFRPETRFVLTQTILLQSKEVDKVAKASRGIGDLLKAGIILSGSSYEVGPSFKFTGLNALKGEMLTIATKRAREAALKFAEESGAKVGGIRHANQGVFSIQAAVPIPNVSDDEQIEKKVRVVSTITYFLVD